MRDILFKGKTLYDGEWVYGSYVQTKNEFIIIPTEAERWGGAEFNIGYLVDPSTVSQCTGWRDRHQARIFENDIVEFISGYTAHRYLIWWHREGSMLTAVPLDGIRFNGSDYWNGKFPQFEYSTFTFMMLDPYGDFRDIRVVGNIINNPELLEGRKNYGTLDN
jgi:uncharacterized phage protein (TIGR01671 family)